MSIKDYDKFLKETLVSIEEMSTEQIKEVCERHGYNPTPIDMYDENEALSILLDKELVFINSNWFMKDWPEEAQKTFAIAVNCNDIFAYGADAELLQYKELKDLYEHHHKDNISGTIVWCIKKRGMFPLKNVYNAIQTLGVWDLDSMNLDKNPSWEGD